MITVLRFVSACAILSLGSLLAMSGCAVDVTEPDSDREGIPADVEIEQPPKIEMSCNGNCCFAECYDYEAIEYNLGKMPCGTCTDAAKTFCNNNGWGLNYAAWGWC